MSKTGKVIKSYFIILTFSCLAMFIVIFSRIQSVRQTPAADVEIVIREQQYKQHSVDKQQQRNMETLQKIDDIFRLPPFPISKTYMGHDGVETMQKNMPVGQAFTLYTSSTEVPWSHNMSKMVELRRLLRKYFYVIKRVSMTKKDVKPWQLVKFDFSDKKYVFPISPTLYDLLPKDSPLINRKYKTCSIVGSSGILLNSKCGAEIDTSDYVIRCNMAPRYGFTTDVGEKTNFMTMNPAILNDRYHLLISTDDRYRFLKDLVELGEAILWSPALTHTGSVTPLRVLVDFLTEHQDKLKLQFAVLGEGAMRYIKGFWKISHNFTEPRITTGLFMYTIAVPICDEIRLYGFYPFLNDTHNNIVPWHYYNPAADPSWLKTVHKMPEEYSILQKLHKQGALKLINRKCKG